MLTYKQPKLIKWMQKKLKINIDLIHYSQSSRKTKIIGNNNQIINNIGKSVHFYCLNWHHL